MSVSLIQLAAKAVGDLYSTLFFPVIPFLCQMVSKAQLRSPSNPPLFRSCWDSSLQFCWTWSLTSLTTTSQQKPTSGDLNTPIYFHLNPFSSCQSLSFLECGRKCSGKVRVESSQITSLSVSEVNCLNTTNFKHLLNLLGLYWTGFFFTGLSHLVLARVFSTVRIP